MITRFSPHPMKKFLDSAGGISKRTALIVALAFVVPATALPQTPPPCLYAVSSSMVINNAGHNYAVGDRLRAVGGGVCIETFPLSLLVASVDSNGAITAATIISANSNGYLTRPQNPIAFGGSATGSDFKASFSFAPP
jgi:hypothetical protein